MCCFGSAQSGSKLNDCKQTLSAGGVVHCVCLDRVNNSIVAGVEKEIR